MAIHKYGAQPPQVSKTAAKDDRIVKFNDDVKLEGARNAAKRRRAEQEAAEAAEHDKQNKKK